MNATSGAKGETKTQSIRKLTFTLNSTETHLLFFIDG